MGSVRMAMRWWGEDDKRAYRERLCVARMTIGRHMDSRWSRVARALDLVCELQRRLGAKQGPLWLAARAHALRCWAMDEMGAAPLHMISHVQWDLYERAKRNEAWARQVEQENNELRAELHKLKQRQKAARDLFAEAQG